MKINLRNSLSIKMQLMFVLMVFTFCSFQNKDFNGIGNFLLGSKFSTIKSSPKFIKIKENEFNIEEIELTKEIGIVRDLTVETKNDKIQLVSFCTSSENNNNTVASYFKSLKKVFSNEYAGIVAYESRDEKISFSKQSMPYGFTKYVYHIIE